MQRDLLLVSANDTLHKKIKSVLEKVNLRTLIEKPSSETRLVAFRADLVIIDEASVKSREEAVQIALKIREAHRFREPAVVLLTTDLGKESRTPSSLPQVFESHVPLSAIEDESCRSLFIRLLYRRLREGDKPSSATQMAWTLFEARASAVVLGTLFSLLPQTEESNSPSGEDSPPEQLASNLDELFVDLSRHEDFLSTLAQRLLAELPSLLWTCLAESLITEGQCEFDGFGSFKKTYVLGRLVVSFDASSVLAKLIMPDIDFAGQVSDSEAMEIFGQNGLAHLYGLTMEDVAQDLLHRIFLDSLRGICGSVLVRKHVKLRADEIWGNGWRFSSWLGILSRAVAFGTYYTLALKIGNLCQRSVL
jgi:hypothetical protein